MKAAVVTEFGQPLVIEDRPVPVFALHAAGRTRVIYETRPLGSVNTAIGDVLAGQARARLVLTP
jgi:hypothetical protein